MSDFDEFDDEEEDDLREVSIAVPAYGEKDRTLCKQCNVLLVRSDGLAISWEDLTYEVGLGVATLLNVVSGGTSVRMEWETPEKKMETVVAGMPLVNEGKE